MTSEPQIGKTTVAFAFGKDGIEPALLRKFLHRFSERWHGVTRRRSRVLALIQADPVLRAELGARERAALAAAETARSEARSGKRDFAEMADALIALRATERTARDACQDAIWYYKSGCVEGPWRCAGGGDGRDEPLP